jgi:hypothetical protein
MRLQICWETYTMVAGLLKTSTILDQAEWYRSARGKQWCEYLVLVELISTMTICVVMEKSGHISMTEMVWGLSIISDSLMSRNLKWYLNSIYYFIVPRPDRYLCESRMANTSNINSYSKPDQFSPKDKASLHKRCNKTNILSIPFRSNKINSVLGIFQIFLIQLNHVSGLVPTFMWNSKHLLNILSP